MEDITLTVPLSADADHAFSVYVAGRWWPAAWSHDAATFERLVIPPRVGARVAGRYASGEEEQWGEVLEYVPGRKMQHTFTFAHSSGVPSVVTAEFAPRIAGGSDLYFRHGGWTQENAADREGFLNWIEQLDEFAESSEFDLRPPATPPE